MSDCMKNINDQLWSIVQNKLSLNDNCIMPKSKFGKECNNIKQNILDIANKILKRNMYNAKNVIQLNKNSSKLVRANEYQTPSVDLENKSNEIKHKDAASIDYISAKNEQKHLVSNIKTQYHKTKLCPWHKKGTCRMGDACNYAHAKDELKPKPDLSKTRLCPDIIEHKMCTNPHCPFAHNFIELRATSTFFKTRLCKFWQKGYCPAGFKCRHAHGRHDLRPNIDEEFAFSYTNIEKGYFFNKNIEANLNKSYKTVIGSKNNENVLNGNNNIVNNSKKFETNNQYITAESKIDNEKFSNIPCITSVTKAAVNNPDLVNTFISIPIVSKTSLDTKNTKMSMVNIKNNFLSNDKYISNCAVNMFKNKNRTSQINNKVKPTHIEKICYKTVESLSDHSEYQFNSSSKHNSYNLFRNNDKDNMNSSLITTNTSTPFPSTPNTNLYNLLKKYFNKALSPIHDENTFNDKNTNRCTHHTQGQLEIATPIKTKFNVTMPNSKELTINNWSPHNSLSHTVSTPQTFS